MRLKEFLSLGGIRTDQLCFVRDGSHAHRTIGPGIFANEDLVHLTLEEMEAVLVVTFTDGLPEDLTRQLRSEESGRFRLALPWNLWTVFLVRRILALPECRA